MSNNRANCRYVEIGGGDATGTRLERKELAAGRNSGAVVLPPPRRRSRRGRAWLAGTALATPKPPQQQRGRIPVTSRAPANRVNARCIALIFSAALALPLSTASAAQWQSPESIRVAAERYVQRTLAGQADVVIEVRGVDERLRLPVCSRPLEAYAEGRLRNGQGTVSVVCSGGPEWRLFVPVRASHTIGVVVAASSLARGQHMTNAHVHLQPRPTTSLPFDYLTRVEDVVGLTLRRSVPAGTVLVPAALDRPQLVQRGALVSLVAGNGGIMVKAEGTALGAAAINERVRVRTQAGRVVEGIVEASNQVRVGF